MEATYKLGRKRRFTTVYWDVAQDKRLSLKARGLFLLMQSLPENWSYTISGLAEVAGVGKDQIRSGLAELVKIGYLIKEQAHDEGGKFVGNIYILQDEAPLSGNPTTAENPAIPLSGNPLTEKPLTGNPTLKDKIYTREDINNTPIPPQGDAPVLTGQAKKRKRGYKAAPDWAPERFARFWDFYRKHVNANSDKQRTIQAWDELKPDDALLDRIATALQHQLKGEEWQRGIGKPHAENYLKRHAWENAEGLPSAPVSLPAPEEPAQGQEGW